MQANKRRNIVATKSGQTLTHDMCTHTHDMHKRKNTHTPEKTHTHRANTNTVRPPRMGELETLTVFIARSGL